MSDDEDGDYDSNIQSKCDYSYSVKFIIVGDSSVGKSNILLRFSRNTFDPGHQATLGIEFANKHLIYNNTDYLVQIWDTAGQVNFRSVTRAYYKASADAGYAKACVKMGEIFVSSSYPFNDKAKSNSYYQKAISAYKQIEGSNGEACYELGRIYQYGKGVKANIEQAKYYYKVGASLGEKNASWRYGLICKDQKSYYEAFTFFLKAAEAGQGMAMYEVAEMYEKAEGVEMSKEKAIEWYLKCEKSNYASASDAKRALRRLGVVENK